MPGSDLDQYLGSLQREDCYRVDRILKRAPHEVTERVFFMGANGAESGPFIRKRIARESNLGGAYERIFAAQQSGLRFRYVPVIVECYLNDTELVVVMELARGRPLDDAVGHMGASVETARSVFPRVCDAVSELHEAFDPPLIHRDLKPSNIMLADNGLTLIDFGIARTYDENADSDTTHFGTRAFAPPEQFGFGQTTVRSDVYALGMLLYFCLEGRDPDARTRDAGFAEAAASPALRDVMAKATALDPAQRFGSARELKAAFLQASGPAYGAAGHEPCAGPADNARPRAPKPRVLTLRNAIVLVFVALWLVVCAKDLVNTPEQLVGRPLHYIVILQGILMPLFGISVGYICLDTRGLKERFPALRPVKRWHVAVGYAVLLVALAVVEAILASVLG